MDTMYEKSEISNSHKIESKNVLLCAETGRVIAVFYNDYDLDNLLSQINQIKSCREKLNAAARYLEDAAVSLYASTCSIDDDLTREVELIRTRASVVRHSAEE